MLITAAKLWNQPEANVAGVQNGVLLCHKEVQTGAAEMAQISEVSNCRLQLRKGLYWASRQTRANQVLTLKGSTKCGAFFRRMGNTSTQSACFSQEGGGKQCSLLSHPQETAPDLYSKHRKGPGGRQTLRQHPPKAEVAQAVPEPWQVPSCELCGRV